MGYRTNFESPLNIQRVKQFEFLTRQQPLTSEKIGKLMELSVGITSLLLAHCMPHLHVAGWDWRKNRAYPMYAWGSGYDVPYPSLRPGPSVNPSDLPLPTSTLTREQRIASAGNRERKCEPVFRDWSVEMFFGPACVGLDAELKGMRP